MCIAVARGAIEKMRERQAELKRAQSIKLEEIKKLITNLASKKSLVESTKAEFKLILNPLDAVIGDRK